MSLPATSFERSPWEECPVHPDHLVVHGFRQVRLLSAHHVHRKKGVSEAHAEDDRDFPRSGAHQGPSPLPRPGRWVTDQTNYLPGNPAALRALLSSTAKATRQLLDRVVQLIKESSSGNGRMRAKPPLIDAIYEEGTKETRRRKILSRNGTPIGIQRFGSGAPLSLVHGTSGTFPGWAPVLPLFEGSIHFVPQ